MLQRIATLPPPLACHRRPRQPRAFQTAARERGARFPPYGGRRSAASLHLRRSCLETMEPPHVARTPYGLHGGIRFGRRLRRSRNRSASPPRTRCRSGSNRVEAADAKGLHAQGLRERRGRFVTVVPGDGILCAAESDVGGLGQGKRAPCISPRGIFAFRWVSKGAN